MWFTNVSCISPVFMYVQWWERCLCPLLLSMRYSNCMSSALTGPHLLYISWQGRTCSQESTCIQCHSSDEEQWQWFSTILTIFIGRITCSPLSFPSKASGSWERESSDFKRQAESSAFWEDGKSIKSCHCPPVLAQIYLTYPHVTPTKVSYQEPAGGQHGPISTSASLMLQFFGCGSCVGYPWTPWTCHQAHYAGSRVWFCGSVCRIRLWCQIFSPFRPLFHESCTFCRVESCLQEAGFHFCHSLFVCW